MDTKTKIVDTYGHQIRELTEARAEFKFAHCWNVSVRISIKAINKVIK